MKDRNLEIENRLTALETKLDELINNHLEYLTAKIDRLHWLVIASLAALVINFANGYF